MQQFKAAHQKQFHTPPDINQTDLPLQDWQRFAEECEDSNIFRAFKIQKKTWKSREIQWKEN